MRIVGIVTAALGTASGLIVSAAFMPGVTITPTGFAVATAIIVLPTELLGYRIEKVAQRRRRRRDPDLANADALVILALFALAVIYMVGAVAVADLASSGFDVDGLLAYVTTTVLTFVGEWGFWWMSPWRPTTQTASQQ